MYARWIAMPKNSNSGSDLATYIASNAELLTEQNYTDIDALVFAEIIHRGVLRMRKVKFLRINIINFLL